MTGTMDGITIVDEVYPVEGYNPAQRTRGYKLINTIEDKFLAIAGALNNGVATEWVVSKTMTVHMLRLNLGIAAVGGSTNFGIRKNGILVGTLIVASGVLVQQFFPESLSNAEFAEGDKLKVEVLATSASTPAYHLNLQVDYRLR